MQIKKVLADAGLRHSRPSPQRVAGRHPSAQHVSGALATASVPEAT